MIKETIKLMRIKHYIKNLLIFFPLLFSGLYSDIDSVFLCILGFVLFCIVSSIVYVINDIKDIEKDKKHEVKKNRPLAKGSLSVKYAIGLIFCLSVLYILISSYFLVSNIDKLAILLPIIYMVINYFYSAGLKNIVLVDVFIIVIGFLIRLFFGACLIECDVSNWLYLTVMSGAFFLGFGKRRNEILKSKDDTRKVLKDYNKDFLDKNMYVSLTLTVVFYSMWSTDSSVIEKINSNGLIWTVPLLLWILFQYSLIIEKDSHGDPVDVFFKNKSILFSIVIYISIILLILV